jgi:tetratricopeptide (TPR) repeat protein
LGNIHLQQGEPEQAETLYRQAQKVMQEVGYSRGLAQVFNNLGMACTQQEKYPLAEESFLHSIALWRQLDQVVSQANAEGNLAEAYLKQHKWEAALQVSTRALERLSGTEPTARVKMILDELHERVRQATSGLTQKAT